jgi:hypothetical protein
MDKLLTNAVVLATHPIAVEPVKLIQHIPRTTDLAPVAAMPHIRTYTTNAGNLLLSLLQLIRPKHVLLVALLLLTRTAAAARATPLKMKFTQAANVHRTATRMAISTTSTRN